VRGGGGEVWGDSGDGRWNMRSHVMRGVTPPFSRVRASQIIAHLSLDQRRSHFYF